MYAPPIVQKNMLSDFSGVNFIPLKMKKIFFVLVMGILFFEACTVKKMTGSLVEFETTQGKIKVKLYPETVKHKENFLKLVQAGFYDGVLFHRVIADFMIQTGDPDSKKSKPGALLGMGDVGYTLPAEFVTPRYYHKRGALSAARKGDESNPKKASSGCQFYIVQGRIFTDQELDALEQRKKQQLEKVGELLKNDTTYKFTAQQRADYKTIGGTPHLDAAYTVFGELIEGQEVVTAISKLKTSRNDRPVTDVRIVKARVLEDRK